MGKKNKRKTIILVVKITIALALLVYVISKVPFRDYRDETGQMREGFLSHLAQANWLLVAAAGVCFLVSLLITGVRWWYLLRIQGVFISLWEGIRLLFLGLFFNAVVPGTVGGDLVKAYYVAKHTPKKAACVVSVFVDRVLGLAELTFMGGVMIAIVLVLGIQDFQSLRLASIVTVCVLAVLVVALAFLLSRRFRKLLGLQRFYAKLPIGQQIAAAGEAARLFRANVPALFKAIGMTFGAHVLFISAIAMAGHAVSVPAPWYAYFLYVPVIYIIGAIPVTPGGVGIIENFYRVFFAAYFAGMPAGVTESRIFALAMLARFIPFLWGLPGVLVAVTGPKIPKPDDLQAELGLAAEVPPIADEPIHP
jgi:glycosyltransferase 2 family protein